MPCIGVMGYQGGSGLHLQALKTLGIQSKVVRVPADLKGLGGLILPGGESSVQYQYCQGQGLLEAIKAFAATRKPLLGTCAGAILLSHYRSEKVNGLGVIDIDVERNTYGRQISSGLALSDKGLEILFIRAPGICSVGPHVEILESYQGAPILVKQAHVYAATYHPEALAVNQENILYTIFGQL